MELAALALLAADGYGPVHGVYNTLGDGHAQPGALCLPHAGVVLPAEGVENLLLILLRHADSGVLHQEVGAHTAALLRLLIHRHLHRALLRREFHRVPQQVDQHLIQPHAVAVHLLG